MKITKPTSKSYEPAQLSIEQAGVLLTDLVHAFTREPKKLTITGANMSHSISFRLKGSASDTGLMIGQQAGTVRSLQMIFRCVGGKIDRPISIIVVPVADPKSGARSTPPLTSFDAVPDAKYRHAKVTNLLVRTVSAILRKPWKLSLSDGNGCTHYEIEPHPDDYILAEALIEKERINEEVERMPVGVGVIFRAIGKNNGRLITACLAPPKHKVEEREDFDWAAASPKIK